MATMDNHQMKTIAKKKMDPSAGDEEENLGLLAGEQDDRSNYSIDIEEELYLEQSEKSFRPRLRWKELFLKIATALFISSLVGGLIAHITWPRDHTPSGPRLRPEEDYILDPHWDFNAKPSTREYHWTIAEHELNPDGVYRDMILINGMFPGPLIECNEGDEIVVHVSNRGSNATSIHWHGLFQNGTNWMDGTVGVTQCPIAPGRDFTYRFNVSRQTGTYWYHSHMSMQASDGVVGPIVIHSRKEEELQKIPYAEDRVVLVSDHYYDLSSELMMDYLAPDRENDEPVPPAAVINGRQQRDCATVPDRRCDSSNRKRALFDLASHHNTRLRFINVGAFAEFQIQIDEHEFYVSEVDGTDVMPQAIHRLNINPAQRYSIIVVPPKSNKGLYWLRARMVTHCFAYEEPELQEEVWGVVRYWGSDDAPTPSSKDWPEVIELECKDLNTSLLSPVIPQRAPAHVDDQIYLRSTFQIKDWALSRGYLNDSSHHVSAANPVLNRLYEPSTKPSSFADSLSTAPPVGINTALSDPKTDGLVYQTTGIRTLDILVQNFDDGNHPFHLHGHAFWVLATGHGYPPPPADLYSPGHLDLENPLRRDTASVEAYGWTLIRFVADNPGVWAFHCHIGWHAEAGLAMQFLARADVVTRWEIPADVTALCRDEGIERGMRPKDDVWFGKIGGVDVGAGAGGGT